MNNRKYNLEADYLAIAMQNILHQEKIEKIANISNVNKAVTHLNNAANLFNDVGLKKEANLIIDIIEKMKNKG